MRERSPIRRALIALLAIGFTYAGAATARRHAEIYRSSTARGPSSSIDTHLAPARIAGAGALRTAVSEAGWLPGEEVVVLARASSVTRGELYQVFYAAGYLLYPSRVRVGAWCDIAATQAQCATLETQTPQAIVARYGARRVLVIGGENPFPSAYWAPLSSMAALVSLP